MAFKTQTTLSLLVAADATIDVLCMQCSIWDPDAVSEERSRRIQLRTVVRIFEILHHVDSLRVPSSVACLIACKGARMQRVITM